MSVPFHPRATVILDTRGIVVKDQPYHAVLTSRSIVLTGDSDGIPRSIHLPEVRRIQQDNDRHGNPVLTIFMAAEGGAVRTVIMHFPNDVFPDAQRFRDLWALEIARLLQVFVAGIPLPDRHEISDAPSFCSRCGNRLEGGSAFCKHCGSQVPGGISCCPESQNYRRWPVSADIPDIPLGNAELPLRDISSSSASGSPYQEQSPGATMISKRLGKNEALFANSVVKVVGIGSIIITAIVIIAVVLISGAPAGSPNSRSDSPGMNIPLPDFSIVQLPVIPDGVSSLGPDNPDSLAEQETILSAENEVARHAGAYGPGEPGTLLSAYSLHFNAGDGAGIRDLLSEKMQSDYSTDVLNQELAQSRSGGYTIENIRVQDQVIEGESAVVVADISWNFEDSLVITSPRIFFVREDNQWKLDTMIMQP